MQGIEGVVTDPSFVTCLVREDSAYFSQIERGS
jgi:hypothetical protein